MVMPRKRSWSTTATCSPPARAQTRKATRTRANISKRDEDNEILECIVVRSSLSSQLITSKPKRLNHTGVHTSLRPAPRSRSMFSNTPVSKSSSPIIQQTSTDSESHILQVSSRQKAIKRDYAAQSRQDPSHLRPETPQGRSRVLPESPLLSVFDSSSEQLSTDILSPCKARCNAPALPDSCKSLASPFSPERQQHLNSNHAVDEMSNIPTIRRCLIRKPSATIISPSNSVRAGSLDSNGKLRKCMDQGKQHSVPVVVPKDKPPTQVPFLENGVNSGTNDSIIVEDFVQGSKALEAELLPVPGRGPLSNMGEIAIPGGTRLLRERGNVPNRSLEASVQKARRSRKAIFQNSGSDELLESIVLKSLIRCVQKESEYKKQGTGTQIPPSSAGSSQCLDREQGYQLSKPYIFAPVLPTTVLPKSGPELSYDPQRCSEKDESDAYVETLLLMSGLSPETVDDMMSQRQLRRVV